ncbi:MAG: hypothetical protein ACREDC_08235 [Bradyrhizobium sp.]
MALWASWLDKAFVSLHGRKFGMAQLNLNTDGDFVLTGDGLHGILQSVTNGITATAGGTQAAAVALMTMINRVATVATGADSVALPRAIAGMMVLVINDGANSVDVYTVNGGTDVINALSDATAYALAATKSALFFCPAVGQWCTLLSA